MSDTDKAAVGRMVNTAVQNAVMTNGQNLQEVKHLLHFVSQKDCVSCMFRKQSIVQVVLAAVVRDATQADIGNL